MISKKKISFWIVAILGIFSIGSAGCAKTGSNVPNSPNTYLAIINAAVYAPAAAFYLNDTLATVPAGIPPGTFSSKYAGIRPGSYDVKFATASNDSLLDELQPSFYDTLNFYTLVLYSDPGGVKAHGVKIWDDFSTISATSASYRFFNLCPDYPSVDVYFNGMLVQPNRGLADNVTNTYYNSFQPLTSAGYTITVKKAGVDSTIASISTSLAAANAYTIFLSGMKSANVNTNPGSAIQINVMQASYTN